MTLTVKQAQDGDFETTPAGTYIARCYQVVDLGTQEEEYLGETKFLQKIRITWELLDEPKMKDGRPFAISKEYTASLSEKSNLYKDLVAWRGKPFTADELLGFEISKLLGAYCQIQVMHKTSKSSGREYAIVNTIMGTKDRPKAVNENVLFDISAPDMKVFDNFSEFLKNKIRGSKEWLVKEAEENADESPAEQEEKDIVIEDIDDDIDLNSIPF